MIKELCDEIYGCDTDELLNRLTCGDSRNWTAEEKNFTLVIPAYLFCVNNHEGQTSKLYEWLSRIIDIPFQPTLSLSFETMGHVERELYRKLSGWRPYEVVMSGCIVVKTMVWADNPTDAANKAYRNIYVSGDLINDPCETVHFEYDDGGNPMVDVDSVEFMDADVKDVGDFVEDEPEEYGYELNHVTSSLTLEHFPSGRTVFLQNEEAVILYDKLEAMKFQSHVNNEISQYFEEF